MTKKPASVAPTEPTAPTKKKRRQLTPKQWAEAEALWESGEMTKSELARKFDVSEQAIQGHMTKYGIKHGSKAAEHKKKVAAEVTKSAVDDATVTAARIRETKEEHYKMSAGLAKLAWSEILTAKQNGAPMATAMNNLKALDAAMNVLSKARMERWAVLGLDKEGVDDDDGLPELLISELTAEQIQALRDRDFNEFEDVDADAVQIDAGGPDADDDDDGDGVVEEG